MRPTPKPKVRVLAVTYPQGKRKVYLACGHIVAAAFDLNRMVECIKCAGRAPRDWKAPKQKST